VQRGDVLRAKPEPDLFIECARVPGAEPIECYLIGDGMLEAARCAAAGADSFDRRPFRWVRRGRTQPGRRFSRVSGRRGATSVADELGVIP
jgi:FMN phosphatase YigB (HAD superfamily)